MTHMPNSWITKRLRETSSINALGGFCLACGSLAEAHAAAAWFYVAAIIFMVLAFCRKDRVYPE